MPTRIVFERSLTDIRDDLLRLSSMVDRSIVDSVRALAERNADLARFVSANDATLNEVRWNIEEHCYTLIATQQPNATDLRDVVGAVSVATNLERIGDHAAGTFRLALRTIDPPSIKPPGDRSQRAHNRR